MQRLRQQSFIKIQLAEWKKDEELSKGAVFESFVKLQRPKSVDLGSSTVNNQPIILIILKFVLSAALRERQTKDPAFARSKLDKIDKNVQLKTQREKAIRDAYVIMPCNEVVRDPDRLLSSTKASENNSLSYEHLYEAERKRRVNKQRVNI